MCPAGRQERLRTYSTQGRGVDGVPLIDLTAYGRQESFQNSPEGWPQRETYTFGKVHDEYTAGELAGLAAPSTTGEVYEGSYVRARRTAASEFHDAGQRPSSGCSGGRGKPGAMNARQEGHP